MLQKESSEIKMVDDHAAEHLAAQEAAMQQVGHVGVEDSDHAMEIGARPQTSDVKPSEILSVALAAAAQPQQLVTKPATTPPQMVFPPVAAAGSIHAAVASQEADAIMRAGAALLLEAALTSYHDSAGTGLLHSSPHQSKHSTKQPYGQQTFVPRKDANDNIPCFVQTSALFTNMCGYCGTRSTSGCWRRGWEIAPNKFINLCNKCGLRHKAGKLPSVPEPPPPQLRGRAAAAAAAAAAGTSFTTASGAHSYETTGHLHHSTSAAELMHLATGQASPNLSTGLQEAAASDPTAGALRGAAAGSGRRRRTQKPLTPKWSRVGPPATEFSHDQHMFAQLLAAGALGSSGGSMDMYAGMPGGLGTDQQQQQQQQRELAALLQSLVEGGAAQAQAGYAPPADLHHNHHPASHSNITGNHNDSTLSLAHYAAAAQTAPMPSSSAAPPPTAAAAGAMPMDSAQAVAAVLAAAAAAASSDSKAAHLQGHPAFKLSKLSVGSGGSGAFDTSQMSSPAAKKRRTKKEAAEEEGLPGSGGVGPSGGRGGEAGKAAQRAEDAAAAGDAADALLALRSSAKPESPSWARLQQATPTTLAPRANPVTTSGMEGMNMMGMNMSRQVTSPSVDTTGGGVSKANGLAHYLQPQHTSSTHPQMPPPQPHTHTHHHPPGSHLEPLTQAGSTYHNFTWSPEQLEARLQAWGCGEAVAAFRANGIEGHALSGLMRVAVDAGAARLDERLRTDLGVEAVGLRLRLVDRMMAELAGAHRSQGLH